MAFLDSVGLAHFKQKLQALFASKEDVKGVVKSVNGAKPDTAGNVQIQTSVDTSNLIPKTGDRGSLAGWESTAKAPNDNSPSPYNKVTQDSPDVMYATDGETTIGNSNPSKSWTKVIAVKLESTGDPSSPDPTGTVSFVLGNRWKWIGGKVPEISAGILVLHWNNGYGVASFIARD